MSQVIDFSVPPTGEDIESARVVQWLVQPGSDFVAGEPLVEIESDKSVLEIGAPGDGTMLEHLVLTSDAFDVSTPIARLEIKEGQAILNTAETTPPSAPAAPGARTQAPPSAPCVPSGTALQPRAFASPAARREMKEQGVSPASVRGSGPAGRITLADVRALAPQGHSPRITSTERVPAFVETSAGRMHTLFRASLSPRQHAPTAVLIHGLFADVDVWSGIVSTLNRQGVDVLAIDLPCHGQSEAVATRMETMVDAVTETLAVLEGKAVTFVAHSFGAAVATRVACTPGLDVHSMVLLAPFGLCTEIAQDFLTGMTHARNNQVLQRQLLKLTANGTLPSAAYVTALSRQLAQRHDLLNELCSHLSWNGVQQVDITPDLDRLRCPVSLLHGRQDQVIPWIGALNAPARVAIHLIPGVGHMPQWEASDVTTEVILRAIA